MLRLGIIGLSEGNGHPYSWAAIFNGYDPFIMAQCPFPVIPAYLDEQSYPEAAIKNAKVTHIWTQDKKEASHVSKASCITYVCDKMIDMIPHVDAVLLARDDAENHLEMAAPFLEVGLPIYIDKPLAYSVAEAEKIYALEQYPGQIFTCSALAYSEKLKLNPSQKKTVGEILYVEAQVIKSWQKYAIHLIDPVLNLVDTKMETARVFKKENITHLEVSCENGVRLSFLTQEIGHVPIEIRVFGTKGYVLLQFSDTFNAFKSALQHFVDIIRGDEKSQNRNRVLDKIAILEAGL